MKQQIIDKIVSYKQTVALIVAFDLSLFEHIDEESLSCEEIASRCGLTRVYLSLLLYYLQSQGLVIQEGEKWSLSNGMKSIQADLPILANIARYESYIGDHWINKDNLEQTLQAEENYRPFDLQGWNEEGTQLYNAASYSNNLDLISIYLKRLLRNIKHDYVYEYGRSNGVLMESLQNKCGVKELNSNIPDALIIYNHIHYMKPQELQELLVLYKTKNPQIVIIIIDYFYNSESQFLSGLLLDWVTHGGIHYIWQEELLQDMNNNGFEIIQTSYMKQISAHIIIFAKGKDKV